MFPHERSLVARLKDEPFALVGVNSDANKDELRKQFADEQITWRSFWAGSKGTQGEIPQEWAVQGWPTLYLIDPDGKIRHRWIGSPGEEVLDGAIESVLAEAKRAGS